MRTQAPPQQTTGPRYPLMERPVVAVALALVAGLLNAWTFGQAQTFATVQSGNIVSVGYALVSGDLARAQAALISIVAFGLGAFVCAVFLAFLARRRAFYSAAVLVIEAILLIALVVASLIWSLPAVWMAFGISIIAGIQGNAFHREAGMLYGNIAVTFVLQNVGGMLGRGATKRVFDDGEPHVRRAAQYAVVLIGFAAGGGIGFAADELWTMTSLTLAATILLAIALTASVTRSSIDPGQNNPTP
ncbi:hypothetical protein GCM10009775_35880 [Microbacterium aoyamense]|uniref:DUF1275 domain-containing protein n=2 Tax=Microbacterium aoyamense TaxID=344166 RepID=A0ABN2Q0V5_9MICO